MDYVIQAIKASRRHERKSFKNWIFHRFLDSNSFSLCDFIYGRVFASEL